MYRLGQATEGSQERGSMAAMRWGEAFGNFVFVADYTVKEVEV
jgi:hypothetical protein